MTLAVTVKYRHRENGPSGEARKCDKQTVTLRHLALQNLPRRNTFLASTNTSLFKDPLFSLKRPPSARDKNFKKQVIK